jgi:hypothetical protein
LARHGVGGDRDRWPRRSSRIQLTITTDRRRIRPAVLPDRLRNLRQAGVAGKGGFPAEPGDQRGLTRDLRGLVAKRTGAGRRRSDSSLFE